MEESSAVLAGTLNRITRRFFLTFIEKNFLLLMASFFVVARQKKKETRSTAESAAFFRVNWIIKFAEKKNWNINVSMHFTF